MQGGTGFCVGAVLGYVLCGFGNAPNSSGQAPAKALSLAAGNVGLKAHSSTLPPKCAKADLLDD